MVLGWALGRWLDGRFLGGHGWGTAIGSIVGVYAGFRALWKAAKMMQAEADREDEEERKRLISGGKDRSDE